MATVQDFVQQTLTLVGSGLTAPGFGKPLIVAYDCPAGFTGLYREYSSQGGPAALLADGFLASGPTYQMAAKLCSQSPCPPLFAVGKGALPPTQAFNLTFPTTPPVGKVYEFELDGISYTAAVAAAAWQASTDYAVGATVTNSSATSPQVNTYVCVGVVGAGESAASVGPTGLGSSIADFQTASTNGVYWAYVGIGTATDTGTALAAAIKSTTAGIQPAWLGDKLYQVGDVVQNDTAPVKCYICTAVVGTGENADTGGPTGTGSHIADFENPGVDGVYWAYVSPAPTIGSTGAALSITAGVAGEFHSLSVTPLQSTTLQVVQNHVDPGIATDLAAILAVNKTWYGFCTAFNSKALVVEASAWALTNNKLLVAQTQDSDVINVAPLTGTDVGVKLLNTGSANANGGGVALIYKSTTDDFADAAWLGACLSLIPGSETWAFKSLVGVPAETASYWLSETQRSNAAGSLSAPGGKQVNLYENVGGANITEKGTVSSSQYLYIDLVRGFAWLQANLSTAVFSGIIAGNKLPFTDAGIAVVEAEIRGVLKQGIANGLLTDNPAPTVTVPKASSVSSLDKANRLLEGVSYTCETAGAIQGVSIQGSVSF